MGWAQATMLYDTASGPPERGTLLESLFVLLAKKRREAEYFKTKSIVLSSIAKTEEGSKQLEQAMKDYRDRLLPFLGKQSGQKDISAKQVLDHWVKKGPLKVQALWRAKDNKGLVSKLRKGADVIRKREAQRRSRRLKRL